ncbi:uncharacterized protein [Macrobrachium rosenbergii]|uniref:uncharacterized protein isoform X3 n=1 Tax=Macrobrachium rosenbergii TaxID=79674 RepID=UPI0034D67CE4
MLQSLFTFFNVNGTEIRLNYRVKPLFQIARGTTTMELQGKESWHDVIIYANKKFTGCIGDEDNKQPNNDDTWLEYCLEPLENAVKIICMEKLNGDAVHFSGRYIGEKFYLIAGSKNVHMLIRKRSDIDLYNGSRFELAKVFARTVCDTLGNLSKDVLQLLFSFLHHTKVTAICEVLQPGHQHIVNLSYLETNELNFITFTPTASGDEETTLTAFPPHHTLKLAGALGLACASYTEIEPKFIMNQRHQTITMSVCSYIHARGPQLCQGVVKGSTDREVM